MGWTEHTGHRGFPTRRAVSILGSGPRRCTGFSRSFDLKKVFMVYPIHKEAFSFMVPSVFPFLHARLERHLAPSPTLPVGTHSRPFLLQRLCSGPWDMARNTLPSPVSFSHCSRFVSCLPVIQHCLHLLPHAFVPLPKIHPLDPHPLVAPLIL